MRSKQLSFIPSLSLTHGGDTSQGKRKIARPIDLKRPLHVVLRSSMAKGQWSLLHLKNKNQINKLTQKIAKKYRIRIFRFVNVGNHIHLLIQTYSRKNFQSFLRELSGTIACLVTNAKKGKPIGRFWDKLAFSRIVFWGIDFKKLHTYLIKNIFEAHGLYGRREKARGLKVFTIFGEPPPLPSQ